MRISRGAFWGAVVPIGLPIALLFLMQFGWFPKATAASYVVPHIAYCDEALSECSICGAKTCWTVYLLTWYWIAVGPSGQALRDSASGRCSESSAAVLSERSSA